jgi:methyl-accepting chemotaxis protein
MLSIAGVWSIYESRSVGSSVQDLLDDNYKSINAARMMIEALEREDSAILLLLLGRWDEGRTIIASADSMFGRGFQTAAANITVSGEYSHIESIESTYSELKELWERPIVDTEREGNLNWYFETVHTAFLDAKAAVNELMILNDGVMFETALSLKQKAGRAVMPGVIAIVSALIFSILFSYFINQFVVNPIVRIARAARRFVHDREPFDVKIETSDELSDLAHSIETLCAYAEASRRES